MGNTNKLKTMKQKQKELTWYELLIGLTLVLLIAYLTK